MTAFPPTGDEDVFDEAGYLRLNPGIATAMATGGVETAWGHFVAHGRAEGRAPNDVDPAFYRSAYPNFINDADSPGDVADAARHYLRFGRTRGYLPHARAPRPPDGSAMASPFGGFWTDRANAADLIQARLGLGWIGRGEAEALRRFARDGIVPLERPLDRELTQAAGLSVNQAFTGMFQDMLFAPGGAGNAAHSWAPEMTGEAVAAQDPHMMSRPIRDLLLCAPVRAALARIFEAPPRLTASRAWLREAAAPERDVSWFAHTLPLQCAAVTFAFDDSAPHYISAWVGSHHWPDLPWSGLHPNLEEARRLGIADLADRGAAVHALIAGRDPWAYEVPAGSAAIRHANLVHTVAGPEPLQQRRTLTAWYCPSFVLPCYVEKTETRWHDREGFAFSSGVYPSLDPAD